MLRLVRKRSQKAGLPPGAPVFVGEQKACEFTIDIIDYDAEKVSHKEGAAVGDCLPYKDTPTVTWINVTGLHDAEKVDELGRAFGLHPLIVEDILNTGQRPKVEVFDDYIFVALKTHALIPVSVSDDDDDEESSAAAKVGELDIENISIVIGKNYVMTFQEKPGDSFDPVRVRISKHGRVVTQGSDYLAYTLMDVIVDSYFGIVEGLGESTEELEDDIVSGPDGGTVRAIHFIRRCLVDLRRSVWPLREVLNVLERAESPLIAKSTRVYLRDLYDHTIQVIETVESQRDFVSGMLDIYLSSISNRLNEVMKILTIFATIFIPLTFITGLYGMNFKYMPELQWHYGYFAVLGLMAAVGISLVIFFRRKKWF